MQIENAVALVTGGASGLGRATAEALVEAGARVVLFDRDEAEGTAAAEALGAHAAFVAGDVTSESSVNAALDVVRERFGALHLCVNCAGIGSGAKLLGRDGPMALDDFTRVINVNLVGTVNVARLAAREMERNEPVGEAGERGVIVNTASVAAYEGQVGQVAYSASKAGICGLTLPAARDLASLGIRVMTIAPGLMETPMMAGLPDKVRGPLIDMVQFPKRLGLPEEYARLVLQIFENAYLNGSVIRLDGAIRMQPR